MELTEKMAGINKKANRKMLSWLFGIIFLVLAVVGLIFGPIALATTPNGGNVPLEGYITEKLLDKVEGVDYNVIGLGKTAPASPAAENEQSADTFERFSIPPQAYQLAKTGYYAQANFENDGRLIKLVIKDKPGGFTYVDVSYLPTNQEATNTATTVTILWAIFLVLVVSGFIWWKRGKGRMKLEGWKGRRKDEGQQEG